MKLSESSFFHEAPGVRQRLLILRHGQVDSHEGDVPVTSEGLELAFSVGQRLAEQAIKMRTLCGETLRTRQTAQAIFDGASSAGAMIIPPETCFAMRNPDIYIAGHRINLVSAAKDFAAQIDGFTEADALAVPFIKEFLDATDRIGYWLEHKSPPGEDAAAVATRINNFAESLLDYSDSDCLTVAVTHSPILRAIALNLVGADPGEPAWVAGLAIKILDDGQVHGTLLSEAP